MGRFAIPLKKAIDDPPRADLVEISLSKHHSNRLPKPW